MVSDLDTGTVEHLADERRKASLDGYFDQLAGIQTVNNVRKAKNRDLLAVGDRSMAGS